MQVIKTIDELKLFCEHMGKEECLADTGFLYAASFDDDRLHAKALLVADILSEHHVPIFANVISRMEFIDLIFRKQVTQGIIQVFQDMKSNTIHKNLYNFLKNIRDLDTSSKKDGQSYKIDEARLKKLKRELIQLSGPTGWKSFCNEYVGEMLANEWMILEEEIDLNYVEVLEGDTNLYIKEPLYWLDMVHLMGKEGLRGPDAMIVNMFAKSRFPLLITNDSDFENCLTNDLQAANDKAIFIL